MRYLRLDDVEHLERGASFLSSGGGGDAFLATQMLRRALETHGPVRLIDAESLPVDAVVLPVVIGGAPSAVAEAFPGTAEITTLREVVQQHLGRPCEAVLPVQMGAVNGLFPLVVAAELGLPCLDSDLMQRCFPNLEMTFLTLAGFPLSPIVMVDSTGSYSIIRAGVEQAGSNLVRATLAEMGMVAVISAYHVTAADCAAHGSARAISRAIELGVLVQAMESGRTAELESCLAACGGHLIFEGTVVEVFHEVSAGITRGVVTVFGDDVDNLGEFDILRLDQQSENLVASINGVPVATVPDIISTIDGETGTVVPNAALARGQHIRVVAIPGDRRWHTAAAATLVGPRAFGFDFDSITTGSHS